METNSIKIGIGCTTYNRPECLAKWKQQIAKHTSMDNVMIYVAIDTDDDRQGVAKRKTECLRALKDCDYIFLFDDDCYPIADGWVDAYVSASKVTGCQHFLFLNDSHKKINEVYHLDNTHNVTESTTVFNAIGSTKFYSIQSYKDCGGVFMFFTKEVVNKVGAFNEKFGTWGFEHAEYSKRVSMAQGYRYDYYSLADTDKYLYAEDYSNPSHKSSITEEEKIKHYYNNIPKFREPIKDIYLPL